MLNWAKQFNIFCYLDNQQYPYHHYECLLAVNAVSYVDGSVPFQVVDEFIQPGQWYFGHLSYDLKNLVHAIPSSKIERIGFPLFFFFQPRILIAITNGQMLIEGPQPDTIYKEILQQEENVSQFAPALTLQQQFSKQSYTGTVEALRQHILKGDCYEINFCQQFYVEDAQIDPVSIFQRLTAISPAPYAALYRLHDKFLISASPERFLCKKGRKILAQPMKGTIKRNPDDDRRDEELKRQLYNSSKERAENVMVVDLVRNDLSRICREGSVKVEELFGIYTFPQVHQMISTISGTLKENALFSEVIAATFPMGSMTGAPKYRVMQLIDAYEPAGRGLFSGSVGYINPDGDFDFNVVIRSILYNAASRYLAYYVGSGITYYSDAEKEWEECLLKGAAIKKVLTT